MTGVQSRILIVDDEPDIVELISYNLEKEGFATESAGDGETALEKIRTRRFDLVILDLMLPGIQGMDLCRRLKSDRDTAALPVLMLTARGEEMDRVVGLEIGADDYVTKPFSVREVIARIKAVLRRSGQPATVPGRGPKSVHLGELEIDGSTYRVTKRGQIISLSATEFRLLDFLARRPGKVFTRDQLLDGVWKNESFVEPRTVDVHIRRLRSQIEDDPAHPVYVKTRRGIGYYADDKA